MLICHIIYEFLELSRDVSSKKLIIFARQNFSVVGE